MSEGKQGLPAWAWVLIAGPLLVFVIGIGSALAIFGVRRYIANAKQAEAHAALTSWSDGLVSCAKREGRLPASSVAVPLSLSAVSGHKYQSAPAEWNQPAHLCAGFGMSGPQYYQYSWSLLSPEQGLLDASADFDGNGSVDSQLQLSVSCAGGRCSHGVPLVMGAGGGRAAAPAPSSSGSSVDDVPLGMIVIAALGVLGMSAASIWVLVLAFQESVGWGFIALLVPCGRMVFVVQHWDRCKKPFLVFVGSVAFVAVLGVAYGAVLAVTGKPRAAAAAPSGAPSGVVVLAPPPPGPPLPAFDGSVIDVSSVMGRARKLANEWESDATLLGVEATVQSGKIQPQLGGAAKVTFGPSRFASSARRTGLFVVTYDQRGIRGAAQPGKPSVTLPEPMCSPEAVLLRVAELGTAPLVLRYGLDSEERPSWLVSPVGEPKKLRIFEPDECAPRGTIVVRPRR